MRHLAMFLFLFLFLLQRSVSKIPGVCKSHLSVVSAASDLHFNQSQTSSSYFCLNKQIKQRTIFENFSQTLSAKQPQSNSSEFYFIFILGLDLHHSLSLPVSVCLEGKLQESGIMDGLFCDSNYTRIIDILSQIYHVSHTQTQEKLVQYCQEQNNFL